MDITNEEIGFDLDLLLPCQTVDNTTASKLEYLRKSIRVAKKRTLVSNSLVTQVLALRKELDAAQNSLTASNKERDEWYTSYNNGCARYKNLEEEIQILQIKNKELEEKSFNATNQCDAVKSHANQLQLLVRENETQLEALKIENKLEKSCVKDLEKTVSSLKKKNENLLRELASANEGLHGKNKLRKNQKLKQKYKKLNLFNDSDESMSGEEGTEDDVSIFDGVPNICDKISSDSNDRKAQNSPTLITSKINKNDVDNISADAKMKHSDNSRDSDCVNEVISVDTGRGSSLAFSDSDKCFHSPDYIMDDSPLSMDTVDANKDKIKVTDIATSPIPKNGTSNIATSPIIFEDESSNQQVSMVKINQLVDRDTSPIQITKCVDISTSPIKKLSKGVIFSSNKRNNQTTGYIHETDHESNSVHREKECLELNNSNNICDDNIIDCEIETILNTMRINHKLITPIPSTPSRPRENNMTQKNNELKTESRHPRGYVCEEAAQVREEYKKLKASFEDLASDVMSIKYLLQNQLFTTNKNDHRIHSASIQQIIDDNNKVKCDRISTIHLLDTNPVLKASESHKHVDVTKHLAGKCAILETSVCDSKTANQSKELSTSNIVVSDDEILPEPIKIKSPTNKAKRLEFYGSVPTEELSTSNIVLSDGEILHEPITIKSPSNIKHRLKFKDSVPTEESSTCNIVLNDDGILQEPITIKSPSNITQILEFNDSVPTEELSTCNVVLNDVEILQEPITESPSNITQRLDFNDSVPTHTITSDSNEDLSTDQIVVNDTENLQKLLINISSSNNSDKIKNNDSVSFTFESSVSFDEFEEHANAINTYASDTESTNLITLTNDEKSDYETSHEYCPNKIVKRKKLTKLEKIRKKMLPKSKISCGVKLLNKSFKPKPLPIYKKQVKESDSAASLNDRSVYEKALKVMAELKLKHKEVNNESADSSLHSTQNVCTKGIHALPKQSNSTHHYDKKCNSASPRQSNSIHHCNKNSNSTSPKQSNSTHYYDKQCNSASPRQSNSIHHCDKNSNDMTVCPKSAMMTRSRSKNDQKGTRSVARNLKQTFDEISSLHSLSKDDSDTQETRKLRKRVSVDKPEIHCKRMLRSSKVNQHILETGTESKSEKVVAQQVNSDKNMKYISQESSDVLKSKVPSNSDHQILSDKKDTVLENYIACNIKNHELRVVVEKFGDTRLPKTAKKVSDQSCDIGTDGHRDKAVSYSDIQMFSDNNNLPNEKECLEKNTISGSSNYKNPKNSILCVMVQRYGRLSIKYNPKKISESATNKVCKMIEDKIAYIIDIPATETKDAMNELVEEIHNLDRNLFIMGLMKYLKDPARRTELYNAVYSPPAPCMTKSEQVLLYIVTQLESADIVVKILDNIEYTLFKLNQTPDFAMIESMSHFYAVLCRYFKAKSRLRLFILDAMYCIQFKAVALIKQCLDVWMHILPLAHMGVAKSPLVTCLVYLLHYYKCEDKFNRVQDIRLILSRKYFYEITEWNEPKILDMFKTAIKDLKDISVEKKMLRMALIIIAKRHGPKWCHNNIIKNLLLPMIDMPNINNRVKYFCISMIGPLLKPYPKDMKVHCEIVMNQLLNMLQQNPSCEIQEAIHGSLIFMSKHNQDRVNQALLSWEPKKVSQDLESVLRDYVKVKPLKVWKAIVSKIAHSNINKE